MRTLLATLAVSLAAQAQLPAPAVCAPAKVETLHFALGETLTFKVDALGAELGTTELSLEAPPPEARPQAAFVIKARAHTSAFVSTNVKRYDAYSTTLLSRDFSALKYKEEVDEGETHRSQELQFPPRAGKLELHATKNGEPDDAQILAGPTARDLLSTLYLLRALPMKPGALPVCVEVYAGRKLWRVTGQIAAREEIDTPLGHFAALRFDATAVRTDDAHLVRSAHVWVSDDARRLPLVAIGDVRGRVLRAQLTAATGGSSAPRGRSERDDHRAAIGR